MMLLSRKMKLVGAFNHQSVFLDPDPDPHGARTRREQDGGGPEQLHEVADFGPRGRG